MERREMLAAGTGAGLAMLGGRVAHAQEKHRPRRFAAGENEQSQNGDEERRRYLARDQQ